MTLREFREFSLPLFFYNIYNHEKNYPGEQDKNTYTTINKYHPGEKLGNYHQKRVRSNYYHFLATENG